MVFRERESQRLLETDDEFHTHIRKSYLTKFSWKSIALALCAGLIPFLLWIAIFQDYSELLPPAEDPPGPLPVNQPGLLKSPSPSMNLMSLPLDIHTRPKPLLKKSSNSKPPITSLKPNPPPTEFGRSSPTTTTIGNKTIVTYHLTASKGLISPDNFAQPALLLNNQSPGPELRVPCNSILIVSVTNHLTTPLTIHFHGLHQRKTFLNDGVPQVTQSPIPPGGSYTYEINTWPQVGTFFYHAHTEMDIVWLYGPLVIEDSPSTYSTYPPAYQYTSDKMFILNGVYHESLDKLIDRIAGPVHSYPTIINSLTINGRSFGVWDAPNSSFTFGGGPATISTKSLSTPKDSGYDITAVEPGVTYRFRFINAASDSLLSCNVSNHTFTIIEMDGIYTLPVDTDRLIISPGQRYSLIITMKNGSENPEGEFWISCRHMEYPGPLNGLAILHLEDPDVKLTALDTIRRVPLPGTATLEMDRWIVDSLQPNYDLNQTDVYGVPKSVDKEWVVDVFEAVIGQQHVYLLNGHYFQEPKIPYFKQLQAKLNITENNQVYEITEGQHVQFVFQNQRTGDFCFSHPWHIHGHSFYVVGQGPNRYDPVVDGAKIQADIDGGNTRFQFRDSLTVYANQTEGEHVDGAWCGWAAVRIAAHNPGVWLAHCHVTPHMMMGKKFVIWEHSDDDPFLIDLMDQQEKGYQSVYMDPNVPSGGW